MRYASKCLSLASSIILIGSGAFGATVNGTVKGPDGSPFKGAFVEAQNQDTRITVNVLSDRNGHYQIKDLPAGTYDVHIRAVGYKADTKTDLALGTSQDPTLDFNLEKSYVRWTDLSIYQGIKLLPDGPGKAKLTTTCFACHGFQSRMASTVRDEDAWRNRVDFMRTNFGYLLRGFTDQDAHNVIMYLTHNFGPNSDLPRSPEDVAGYQDLKQREFSDAAMRIVYVTYEMPGANRFPGAAKPERDGKVYIWTYNNHRFAILDPKTVKVDEYNIPNIEQASNHSTVLAPDGTVWFTEQAENAIGEMDPKTGNVVKYHDNVPGNRHTMVINSKGIVYSTGEPLSRFDPKTKEFTNYDEVPTAYGITLDSQENIWFSEFKKGGEIGKIDAKTGKITKYMPPTPDAYPRRMHMDSEGLVWFCEYRGGKIASFDPKTEQFKEYPLPGADPTPYAMNIDKNHHVWYSSMDMDMIGELDPATGKVIEYPFIYAENGMRDFFMDSKGNMWWGSQPNNHVGYFYLAPATPATQSTERPGGEQNQKQGNTTVIQE